MGAFLVARGEDEAALERVEALLEPPMFASPALGTIYGAIRRLRSRKENVDPLSLEHELAGMGELEAIGGIETLANLIDAVPSAASIEGHAQLVHEKARRRRVREVIRTKLGAIEDPGVSLEALLEGTRRELEGLAFREPDAVPVRTLASVLEDPASLEPPTPAVPRLVWLGRTTLLSAREKAGKSTLASAVAAAVSAGLPLFGQKVAPGKVLYVGLEEHLHDLARRLVDFGAAGDEVALLERVESPFKELSAAVRQAPYRLIIIDTLAAFVESLDLDPGNAADWTPVMQRLARIARESGAAILILHHARKSDGKYRDSTAIGAGVDVIVTMRAPEIAPTIREFSSIGRWPTDDFRAHLVEANADHNAHYAPVVDDLPVEQQVVHIVTQYPGTSMRGVRSKLKCANLRVQEAVESLLASGELEDRGSDTQMKLYAPVQTLHRTAVEPVGNRSGTGFSEDRC